MRIRYQLTETPLETTGVLVLSTFDGAHRGHRALLREAGAFAAEADVSLTLAMPWPGSAALTPKTPALSALDERVVVLDGMLFALNLGHMPARPHSGYPMLHVLRAPADVGLVDLCPTAALRVALEEEAEALGLPAQAEGWRLLPTEGGGEYRSALALLAGGHVAVLNKRLECPFTLRGTVVQGDQRGRLLGFPTANFAPEPGKAVPAFGVYAGLVALPSEAYAAHPAVLNIGVRPTFGEGHAPLVEAHLLDATFDLYGLRLRIACMQRIREERRFEGVEALREQIARDAEQARTLLARTPHGVPLP